MVSLFSFTINIANANPDLDIERVQKFRHELCLFKCIGFIKSKWFGIKIMKRDCLSLIGLI